MHHFVLYRYFILIKIMTSQSRYKMTIVYLGKSHLIHQENKKQRFVFVKIKIKKVWYVHFLQLHTLARWKPPVWPSPPPEPSSVPSEIWSISLTAPVSTSSCIWSTSSTPGCSTTTVWLQLGGGRFRPQSLYFLCAAREMGIRQCKMQSIGLWVEVTVCQSGAHSQPA